MFGLNKKHPRTSGYNTKHYRARTKKNSDYKDEEYDEEYDDEYEEEEEEEDDTRNYGREINPRKISVLAKKYLDDDEENYDTAMRVSIIRDNTTGQEYIVFDSANGGLVVKERNNLVGELLQAKFDLNKGEGQ